MKIVVASSIVFGLSIILFYKHVVRVDENLEKSEKPVVNRQVGPY